MASEDRATADALSGSDVPRTPEAREVVDVQDLEQALADKPYEFSFMSAARFLECRFPDRPKIGTARRPGEEPVRFGQDPYLHFAPATLKAYRPSTADRPGKLTNTFFGLFGPDGALPLHLTEYALNRIQYHKDTTFARFVDVFHHRMTAFFYRAWAAARPSVSFDRPAQDRFATYVGSLAGIGMASMRHRDAMPDLAKLFYAGHFANQTRHADGLAAMLEDYFEVPVSIEELVPEWLTLPEDSRLRLGSTGGGVLGESATIGARIFHCQHKIKLLFGPMTLKAYRRMTPDGDNLACLVAFVRNYIGDEFAFDLNLVLLKDEVPRIELGKAGALGWTTWLGERKADTDANDMVINPVSAFRQAPALAANDLEPAQLAN